MDEKKIKLKDAYLAVKAVSRNEFGKLFSWIWLQANWDVLRVRLLVMFY